jgi:hypothetical protein
LGGVPRRPLRRSPVAVEEALAASRRFEIESEEPHVLASLAIVAVYEGDQRRAEALVAESVRLGRQFGDQMVLINRCLPALAALHAASGDAAGAARLIGAADARRAELGSAGGRLGRELKERILASVRTQLDAAALAEALEEGASLTLEAALAESARTPNPARPAS